MKVQAVRRLRSGLQGKRLGAICRPGAGNSACCGCIRLRRKSRHGLIATGGRRVPARPRQCKAGGDSSVDFWGTQTVWLRGRSYTPMSEPLSGFQNCRTDGQRDAWFSTPANARKAALGEVSTGAGFMLRVILKAQVSRGNLCHFVLCAINRIRGR